MGAAVSDEAGVAEGGGDGVATAGTRGGGALKVLKTDVLGSMAKFTLKLSVPFSIHTSHIQLSGNLLQSDPVFK